MIFPWISFPAKESVLDTKEEFKKKSNVSFSSPMKGTVVTSVPAFRQRREVPVSHFIPRILLSSQERMCKHNLSHKCIPCYKLIRRFIFWKYHKAIQNQSCLHLFKRLFCFIWGKVAVYGHHRSQPGNDFLPQRSHTGASLRGAFENYLPWPSGRALATLRHLAANPHIWRYF